MNRFEKDNALYKIEGYFLPKRYETTLEDKKKAFERAKSETIFHHERALECLKQICFEDFKQKYGRAWK